MRWKFIRAVSRVIKQVTNSKSKLLNAFAQDSGSTPLHYAVRRSDIECVNILLAHGAKPSIRDNLNHVAADYCDGYLELRGGLRRICNRKQTISSEHSLKLERHASTAADLKFPMYLVPLRQLQSRYGGSEPKFHRIEAHQVLKERQELIRWIDIPFDSHIIFLSHEWVGWSHPDPHGVQLRTFLRVMHRLRTGEIAQVDMNAFHVRLYKDNVSTKASEWKDILSSAYVKYMSIYTQIATADLTLIFDSISLAVTYGLTGLRCLNRVRVLRVWIRRKRKRWERI